VGQIIEKFAATLFVFHYYVKSLIICRNQQLFAEINNITIQSMYTFYIYFFPFYILP